jgi:hypothetical protein
MGGEGRKCIYILDVTNLTEAQIEGVAKYALNGYYACK